MNKTQLAQRILAKRIPKLAARIQEQAVAEGLAISFVPDMASDTARILVSGFNLSRFQFGDETAAATAPIARMLQAVATTKRQIT